MPLATAPVGAVAVAVTVLLLAVASRYGYHRDELYFLTAGHHLAWGYPDQPPLVPALARLVSTIAPGSVAALRVPSALAAGTIVVLTALTAVEFGATSTAQVLAAAAMGTGAVLLGSGHLLSTTTFDLLAWSVLLWLITRALRTGVDRYWLLIGLVAGVGLLDSDLVAFLMAGVVAGLLLAGPRSAFRSPWLWAGGALAALMWSPYLAWQASHGWPQFAVSRSIAAGHSGSSQPRWLLLPQQLGLLSPYLAPIWIAGLVGLWRDPALRWCRALGVAYVVLAVVFVVTGGKGYYLAGMFPLLLAAGAGPTVAWLHRRRARRRQAGIGVGIALAGASSILVTLPVLPVTVLHDTPIVSVNYDAGETVAWPTFVAEIAAAYRQLPTADRATAVIVGSNYGEAGAVDRYGGRAGLPHAYGVHNGFWYWGPPPNAATEAIMIGFTQRQITPWCGVATILFRLDNHLGVKNQEQGAPVWLCSRLRASWTELASPARHRLICITQVMLRPTWLSALGGQLARASGCGVTLLRPGSPAATAP